MKTKKYWILAICVCCCVSFLVLSVFGISPSEEVQLKNYGISTLKGLRGVCVIVMYTGDESGRVSQDALQTKVEMELRKAGIKVFSDTPDVNVGILSVTCNMGKVKNLPQYFGTLFVSLHQWVQMTRNPKIQTRARTWPLLTESTLFFAGEIYIEQHVDNILTKSINIFINDYLAANPKEPEKKKPTLDELIEKNKARQ